MTCDNIETAKFNADRIGSRHLCEHGPLRSQRPIITGQWSKLIAPCIILGAYQCPIAMQGKSKEVVVMDQADTDLRSEISDATKLRDDLDGLVVNMELTLISIIQGVALYFLTDSSRTPLMAGQVAVLPYVIIGLLIIFLF